MNKKIYNQEIIIYLKSHMLKSVIHQLDKLKKKINNLSKKLK